MLWQNSMLLVKDRRATEYIGSEHLRRRAKRKIRDCHTKSRDTSEFSFNQGQLYDEDSPMLLHLPWHASFLNVIKRLQVP